MNTRVLVIDDDEIDRTALKRKLKKWRRRITFMEAKDRDEALRIVNEEEPDVIFCDWALAPYRDGLEFVSWVRENEANNDNATPIVIVSGYLDETLVSDSLRCGANAALEKPVDQEQLRWTMDDLGL